MTLKLLPNTPQGYKHAIKELAKRESQRSGIPTGELVERHYHRRLLARVFTADGDSWLLKGGQAMLARWSDSRHSTDIDLISQESTLDVAVKHLITATKFDLKDPSDPLTYVHTGDLAAADMEQPTIKVYFEARIGLIKMHSTSVDVVPAGDRPRGTIIVEQLPFAFPSSCETWPDIRIYPLEDVVGDKLCAMHTGYGASGNGASTRYKDLVDLVLVALKSTLPADFTHEVVHLEAARRRAAGTPVNFPDRFTVPNDTWTRGYAKSASGVGALPPELRTLSGVHELADAFITPLLQATPPSGHWRPDEQTWR